MVFRWGLFSNNPFEPAQRTKTSIVASGKFARNSWMSGVAKIVSPMPANEMTRIFICDRLFRAFSKFRNFFEDGGGGFAGHEGDDFYFSTGGLNRAAFV